MDGVQVFSICPWERTGAFSPRISGLENDMQGLSLDLPTGYYLERDPDVLILRRLDGSMVGALSARAAAPEAVLRMVEETVGERPSAQLPETQAYQPALEVYFFGHFEVVCD